MISATATVMDQVVNLIEERLEECDLAPFAVVPLKIDCFLSEQ